MSYSFSKGINVKKRRYSLRVPKSRAISKYFCSNAAFFYFLRIISTLSKHGHFEVDIRGHDVNDFHSAESPLTTELTQMFL